MKDERLYADHDLRVAKLADMMNLPEHSLRKKINKQLGYRNFNQFVNQYRIKEAGQRLNEEPTIPVLSVALDVGFRSISSFNTAFQSQYGMSPTEYRRQSYSRYYTSLGSKAVMTVRYSHMMRLPAIAFITSCSGVIGHRVTKNFANTD